MLLLKYATKSIATRCASDRQKAVDLADRRANVVAGRPEMVTFSLEERE
jgi:hypothetical protein